MSPRAAIIVAVFLIESGCGLFGWDHREEVALLTLVNEQDGFDQAVYAAALSTRYPNGTSVKNLEKYVIQAKGECNPSHRAPGALWCEIPLKGGLCWAQMIGIDVRVNDGLIADMKVVAGGLTC